MARLSVVVWLSCLAVGLVAAGRIPALNPQLNDALDTRDYRFNEDLGSDEGIAAAASTEEPGQGHQPLKRYPVFNVEFARIETPFIIGLWIFCASLAKIGNYL